MGNKFFGLLAIIIVLIFTPNTYGQCESQLKDFYVRYMENVEKDPAANECLMQKHMSADLIAKLQTYAKEQGFDGVINAQDVCSYGMQSLKVLQIGDDCYMVTYKWDEKSESTLICVKAGDAGGVLKISDIIPLPL